MMDVNRILKLQYVTKALLLIEINIAFKAQGDKISTLTQPSSIIYI